MSKIKIKNFGPIKEGFDSDDGFMDIKKVTIFIGDQGSGKSSVAKLFSTLSWLEKAINRGEIDSSLSIDQFMNYCNYQGLKNYVLPDSEIEYHGDAYSINFNRKQPYPIVRKNNNTDYTVPKIMYTPAERNFLSIIKSAYDVTGIPAPLITFAEELKRAQIELNGNKLDLPVRDYVYEYDEHKDISHVSGLGYKINLLEASSGLQSLIPLYLVSKNLASSIAKTDDNNNTNISVNQLIRRNDEIAKIALDNNLSEEDKKKRVSKVYARFHNKCFINIVEEAEQNLYPISQKELLNSLTGFNNLNRNNKLIMTTHSPYLINYLSIAIQGQELLEKIKAADRRDLIERLKEIIPVESCVSGSDVVIYQLENGTINRLPVYEGIPSDKNYLNKALAEGNQFFGSLLEIEEEL